MKQFTKRNRQFPDCQGSSENLAGGTIGPDLPEENIEFAISFASYLKVRTDHARLGSSIKYIISMTISIA